MIRGIIYKYTGPNGKSYIGQTINEKLRRKLWKSSNNHYAGDKIDRARAKYGKDTFDYSILFEKNFSTNDIASIWLNIAEQYYIQLYDSVANGYNCEAGGGGNASHIGPKNHHHSGYTLSEEARANISKGLRTWQNTPDGKAKMSAARRGKSRGKGRKMEALRIPVVQLSLQGVFIKEYPCIRDVAKILGSTVIPNISSVCKGKKHLLVGINGCIKKTITD